jgi:molybdate transport system regulatory protein
VAKKSAGFILRPRLRVERGKEIALGPGKVELLKQIVTTGSIAEAAERMEMSYMRAWKLVKTMEACFRQPLVEPRRGGSARGGATLTKAGTEVLEIYHEMDAACVLATARQWERLRRHLRH